MTDSPDQSSEPNPGTGSSDESASVSTPAPASGPASSGSAPPPFSPEAAAVRAAAEPAAEPEVPGRNPGHGDPGPDPAQQFPTQQYPAQQFPTQQNAYSQNPYPQNPFLQQSGYPDQTGQTGQTSQPGPKPYQQPYPQAAYQQPAPARPNRFTQAFSASTWKTSLVPAAVGLGAGLLVAIVLTVLLATSGGTEDVAGQVGASPDKLGYALPFVLLSLALGGSAKFTFEAGSEEAFGASGVVHASFVPLLVSIALVGGFWWMSRWYERRDPSPNVVATWVRIGVSTLALGLVIFFLQLIFAARYTLSESGMTLYFALSAATPRSFFLPLLVLVLAAFWARAAGHFKGLEAVGAAWLRPAVPALYVAAWYLAVCTVVFTLVAVFVLPLGMDIPWQVVPLLAVNAALWATVLVHFGGLSWSMAGEILGYGSTDAETVTIFGDDVTNWLWLGLLVVVLAVLVALLVTTVTRRPAWVPQPGAGSPWATLWIIPLVFLVGWGLLSLLVLPVRASLSGQASAEIMGDVSGAGSGTFSFGAVPWSFVVFAVWGLLVDVASRTIGPKLAVTLPGLASRLGGRAVHPYWGQPLGMREPTHALRHPDVVADMRSAPTVPTGPEASPGAVPASGPGVAGPGPDGRAVPGPAAHGAAGAAGVAGAAGAAWAAGDQVPPPPGVPVTGSGPSYPAGSPVAGTAYPAAASAPGTPAGPPVAPMNKRKVTILSITAGAVVLVLVGGIIALTQVNKHMFGPSGVVGDYLAQLQDGDAEGALKIADVDVPAEQRTLLTSEVLGGAKALPDDIEVGKAQVSGDTATVSASFDLDGAKATQSFTLTKTGKKGVLFDEWTLDPPELGTLDVGTGTLSKVKVNGVDVDVATEDGYLSMPAFPAQYDVGLAVKSKYVSADAVTPRVFFAGSGAPGEDAALLPTPTDAFKAEVETQVKTLLDGCAASTEAQPDGCPFGSSYAESVDAKDVVWSIESYPTVAVAEDGYYGTDTSIDGAEGLQWEIYSETPGEAMLTGQYEFFGDTETLEEPTSIDVYGSAGIVDDKVVISVEEDGGFWG